MYMVLISGFIVIRVVLIPGLGLTCMVLISGLSLLASEIDVFPLK